MAGPVTLVNTGHTVQVIPGPGSYIVAGGVRYDLVQFHFHHPSEHHVDGKVFAMEAHFVNQAADGSFCAIGVFIMERGKLNPPLSRSDHIFQTACEVRFPSS